MVEMGSSVLVVVDDGDHLQHFERVSLLRVVRLLGRFPGVSYLLAYEEQTLLSNLRTTELGVGSRTDARLFLEKVIQYPVAVPPLLRRQVLGAPWGGPEPSLRQPKHGHRRARHQVAATG